MVNVEKFEYRLNPWCSSDYWSNSNLNRFLAFIENNYVLTVSQFFPVFKFVSDYRNIKNESCSSMFGFDPGDAEYTLTRGPKWYGMLNKQQIFHVF